MNDNVEECFNVFMQARDEYMIHHEDISRLIASKNTIERNIKTTRAEAAAAKTEWKEKLRQSFGALTKDVREASHLEASRKAMEEEMNIILQQATDEIHFAKINAASIRHRYNAARLSFLEVYISQQTKAMTDIINNAVDNALKDTVTSILIDINAVTNSVKKHITSKYHGAGMQLEREEYRIAFSDESAMYFNGQYSSKSYISQQRRKLNIQAEG